jgi:hypothetical protein
MCPYPNQQAARSGVPSAANDNGLGDGDDAAAPLPALLSLAKLLARREAARVLAAANDNDAAR